MNLFRKLALYVRLLFALTYIPNLWRFLVADLNPTQLALIQADLDAAKAAAVADDQADAEVFGCNADVEAAQVALTGAVSAKTTTADAVDAADQKLLADVQAMFTPAA